MPTIALPFIPPQKVSDGIIEYCKQITAFSVQNNTMRQRLEYIDREFYRENTMVEEDQKAKIANRVGNKRVIRDVVQPILEPQIETTVSFLSSVFLTGFPIFGVAAPPQLVKQGQTMEAIIAENSIRGGWRAELVRFFRNGAKYNFAPLELDWDSKTIYSPVTETVAPTPGNSKGTSDKNKETIWEGNCLTALDPYNTHYDLRVHPNRNHIDGEFVGYTRLMSRVMLKQFIQDLPSKTNVTKAFESSAGNMAIGYQSLYYIPSVNPDSNYSYNRLVGGMDWNQWAALDAKNGPIAYNNVFQVTVRYCRLIPSDFGMQVPKANQPQIWKIITVNDQVVIYMERQTNAHNYLPVVLNQPYNDMLGLQTKGLGEKLIPIQDLASASWNARLFSQRRKLSDRALYDPLRISPSDMNNDQPNAKIPVKAGVYGKPVGDAYHQIPFEDNQSGSFVSDGREFNQFANIISGQNQAQQGQFVKGNKTMREYEDVVGHSSGRQQTLAISIEDDCFSAVKEMIKLNILQYQPDGPVTNPLSGQTYQVNRQQLQQLSFGLKISDGLTPKEKILDTESFQVAIQTIGSSPALQAQYNLGDMFTYLMSQQGADLSPFQRTPDQVAEQQETQADAENAQENQQELASQVAGAIGQHLAPQPPAPQIAVKPQIAAPVQQRPTK